MNAITIILAVLSHFSVPSSMKIVVVVQETFLADLKALKPEVCVTAAYGNILPNKFLEIPQHGESKSYVAVSGFYKAGNTDELPLIFLNN